ncbi:diacylglycerol kinase family protein [Nocardioides sp. CFH 31398]|uniref:diacylglycerol kinase family protein n=1 Tax=Nocardioides sp. CFH 31398 TaxID=2919579 RepID=UPI001F057687|nr:diacylglycerol kinase family protein [Nocardioides sp. CFH 31398]MCH1865585.1 phosphatase PAP2 family protein [Nocardioides sp. CFH 31398]
MALLALLGLLSYLVVSDFPSLGVLDDRGRPVEAWATDIGWLRSALAVVEDLFGTVAMTMYTVLLAVALIATGQRRSGVLVALVMGVTAGATTLVKTAVGRDRPVWQDTGDLLTNFAFPSGHASSITALAGLVLLVVLLHVRSVALRRLVAVTAPLAIVLVCLDRVLLGRHYPSDVVGGFLLGGGVLLVLWAVVNPPPTSRAVDAAPLPEVFASERRLAVVLNPVKVDDVARFSSTLTTMAEAAGWSEPTFYETTVEDPGTGMAEAAAVAGADLVIVCGGDGTVREVCAELAGTGIPVGIVPAGTGNLLARNLGIPLVLRSALDVALSGQDRAIDLGTVSGDGMEDTHFMVMAGMGFDAAIMEGVNDDFKRRVGWLAYVVSGFKSIMYPAVRVEVSVDGGEWTKHRARTIVVGNVGYLQAGMPLLPDAAIDDGVLDLVLLHPRRLFSWIPLAWRVIARRPHTDELVNRMVGRTISIRTSTEAPRQLDGDTIGPGHELHLRCEPGRVLVRVPR